MSLLTKLNAIWRVPVILSWTALMAILSLTLSLVDHGGRLQHGCARLWSQFILRVSRVQVEMSGLDQLDPARGYLFAANHLSMFDHWAFLACLPRQFRFVAKASLFQLPFLGWHLRRSGNLAVDRQQHRKTLRVFRAAAKKMEEHGLSFVVYPEGARTWGDQVLPFKRGSLLLARYAKAPIVPVTIIGAHRRLPRGSALIVPGKMQMIIHPPIDFDQYQHLDPEALAETVRQTIIESYRQVP